MRGAILRTWNGSSPAEEALPLLKELEIHGAEGLWTALEIISMLVHGKNDLPRIFADYLKDILINPVLFDKLRKNTDGYNLEQAIKRLAVGNYIDKSFARTLVKQLLSVCEKDRSSVFYELDSYVRTALATLMEIHPKEVWAGISTMLLSDDGLLTFMLENLLKFERDDHLGEGLLFALPSELYLDWVRQNPVERGPIVVNWLPIAIKDEHDVLKWHPFLEEFVMEFGNNEDVLMGVARRFHPSSWWGSLVPYLEPLLPLLAIWSNHQHSEVRKWVANQTGWIDEQIAKEKHRDEESVVRYS